MRLRNWPLLAVSALIIACGSDSPVEVVNQAPSILFTFAPLAVQRQTNVTLTVSVSDPNPDDDLTVTWQVSQGALTPLNAERTQMNWAVPVDLGMYTVTATVSDGQETDSVTEEIYSATVIPGNGMAGPYELINSPFLLVPPDPGDISISSSATFEPGVEFFVGTEGASIQVDGTLNSNGTAAMPVIIRPNDRTLRCGSGGGWWVGLAAIGTGQINLNHTEIWFAEQNLALRAGGSGSASVRNSKFRCGAIGILVAGSGWLSADSCLIDNNDSYGIRVATTASLPDSVAVRHSRIEINRIVGVELDIAAPGGNTVPVIFHRNRIDVNFTHGITVDGNTVPTIHYNHFESNGLSGGASDLRLEPGYDAVPTLDCTNNYWGGANTEQSIKTSIRDQGDDPGTPCTVIVDPWLTTSPFPLP